ncbi:hypothetical protein ASG25_09315 [Rhizobium sp. Leaf384]|nr:hypothetical protein ASG25_09315 [Rhizobium sp. Leaf384]
MSWLSSTAPSLSPSADPDELIVGRAGIKVQRIVQLRAAGRSRLFAPLSTIRPNLPDAAAAVGVGSGYFIEK